MFLFAFVLAPIALWIWSTINALNSGTYSTLESLLLEDSTYNLDYLRWLLAMDAILIVAILFFLLMINVFWLLVIGKRTK